MYAQFYETICRNWIRKWRRSIQLCYERNGSKLLDIEVTADDLYRAEMEYIERQLELCLMATKPPMV